MKLDMSNIDNDHHFIENNFNNQNLQPSSICYDNVNIKIDHDAEAEANDENESDLSMSASVDAVHPGDSESTQEGMSSNHSQQELPANNAVKTEPNTLSPNTNRNKVKEIFQCILCDKSYRKRKSLVLHFQNHQGFCVDCGKEQGTTPKEIVEHNRQFHVLERPFICELCGESFSRNQQFQVHTQAHEKKNKNFKFFKNKLSPPEKEEVKDDSKKSRKRKPLYNCVECNLPFSSEKFLQKHIKSTGHKNDNLVCDICGSIFDLHVKLQAHIQRSHNNSNKDFKCPHCFKNFSSKSNMERHIILHTGVKKTFICEKCGTSYTSHTGLREHIKIAHGEAEKKFQCSSCDKAFPFKKTLKRHETTHSDERAHKCDLCNTSFKRRAHLLRHYKLSHRKEDVKKELLDPETGGSTDIPLVSDLKEEQKLPLHNNISPLPPHPLQNNDNKIDNLPFYNYNSMQKSNNNLMYNNAAQYNNNVHMLQPHANQLQHPGVLHSPQHHVPHQTSQHRNNNILNQYGTQHQMQQHSAQQQSLHPQHPHHHQQHQQHLHQHPQHLQQQQHQIQQQQQHALHQQQSLHAHHHLQQLHQQQPQAQAQAQQQSLQQQHPQQYHHQLPVGHQQHHYNHPHQIQQPNTSNWQNVNLCSTSTSTSSTPTNNNPPQMNNYHQNVDRNNRFIDFIEGEQIMDMNNADLLQYPDVWNANLPQMDYTNNANPNIYNNIGNILTNLDNIGNQSTYEQNFDIVSSQQHQQQQQQQQEQNLYKTANMYPKDHLRNLPPQQYNIPPQQPPPPIYHQQVRENVSHHATPSPSYSSGPHMDNYDLSNSSSSQNHTITDISNTFLKNPINQNSNSNMQMDFYNTIGVPPRTHQQQPASVHTQQHPMHAQQQIQAINQNNVNSEVTSSSLADYMHHPFQYI